MTKKEDMGASSLRADRATDASHGAAKASPPSGSVSAGAWPSGPYRYDDISTDHVNDGLGYIYIDDGGYSPTLAHTGDTELTAEQNRALGHLFAAAPDLHEALMKLSSVAFNVLGGLTPGHLADSVDQARAALSRTLPDNHAREGEGHE